MKGSEHLNGLLYHMVDRANLESIFRSGKLYSKNQLQRRATQVSSIANDEVQRLRARISIDNYMGRGFLPLHNFIPFYFATRTPMQYLQVQANIVLLTVSRRFLSSAGVVFTDGNATMQRLSKYFGEQVEIRPARFPNIPCTRTYHPSGPRGLSKIQSNIYSQPVFLDQLDWAAINDPRSPESNYKKCRKQAEVLIPDSVDVRFIEHIYVPTQESHDEVSHLLARSIFSSRIILRPDLFF